MENKKEHSKSSFNSPGFRIILAYGLTIGGILALPWLYGLMHSHSWLIGVLLFMFAIPLFPAVHAILLKKIPANLFIFLKIYAAEFASFFLQLALILVSAPVIAIMVAGRLAIVLLITAIISWFIVALQQIGVDIGSKMPKNDIIILLWVTIGLIAAVGFFCFFNHLIKKHEDGYFTLWANQFLKIRKFFNDVGYKDQ